MSDIKKIIEALETEMQCENCPHINSECKNDDCYFVQAATALKFRVGLCSSDGTEIALGDKVQLVTGDIGEIVFECGAYGVAFQNSIDYDKIQAAMDEDDWCCGNHYSGCKNDNFISLWELHWNFNCENDHLMPITRVWREG